MSNLAQKLNKKLSQLENLSDEEWQKRVERLNKSSDPQLLIDWLKDAEQLREK